MFYNVPLLGWLIIIALYVFFAYPVYRIMMRAGFSKIASVSSSLIFPFLGVIVLWVLAFIDWPNLRPEIEKQMEA